MDRDKKKMMAFAMAFMMLAGGLAVLIPAGDETDAAAPGDNEPYSYTIVYDESKMETGTDSISVGNMEAIYHPSYTIADGTSGYGSWDWTDDGIGPFNSFYAAFDIDKGNKMVARLNPFDLSKTVAGTDLPDGRYNIMWVLPTVFWKIGETTVNDATYPTLTLTNDQTAGGTAYAHMINGHVYNYVAYGVYEGYNDTITVGGSSVTVLTSQTDKTPTLNVNRDTFRTYAHNYSMDAYLAGSAQNPAYSMLWNFYQWELYKYCSLTLMENFDAQSTVGNGKVHTTDSNVRYNTTGLTDESGPYAGTIGAIGTAETSPVNGIDSEKLFIENAWGSLSEFVDGVVFNYTELYSESVPDSATTVDIYIQTSDTPDNYYESTTGTDSFVEKIKLSSRYHPEDESVDPTKLSPTVIKTGPAKTLASEDEPIDPSITGNGYPLYIITNDARMWGFGDQLGGSATTGVSDYEWIPTSTGPKVLSVGGASIANASNATQPGLSCATSADGLDRPHLYVGSRVAFVFDVDTTADATYTAKLSFDANKGTGAPATMTFKTTSENDVVFTIPSTVPFRSNMYFLGWNTVKTATTATYQPGDTFTSVYNGSNTLYAIWIAANFTVDFNANGGSGGPKDMYYHSDSDLTHTFTIPATEPTWVQHGFLGWSTDKFGEVEYAPGDTITMDVDETVKLYAIWERTGSGEVIGSIIDLIPILLVVGVLLGIVAMIAFRKLNA